MAAPAVADDPGPLHIDADGDATTAFEDISSWVDHVAEHLVAEVLAASVDPLPEVGEVAIPGPPSPEGASQHVASVVSTVVASTGGQTSSTTSVTTVQDGVSRTVTRITGPMSPVVTPPTVTRPDTPTGQELVDQHTIQPTFPDLRQYGWPFTDD